MAEFIYHDPSLAVTPSNGSRGCELSNGFTFVTNVFDEDLGDYQWAIGKFNSDVKFVFHQAFDRDGERLHNHHGLYVSDLKELNRFWFLLRIAFNCADREEVYKNLGTLTPTAISRIGAMPLQKKRV